MLSHRKIWLTAGLLALGCLVLTATPRAAGQDKKEKDVLFGKAEHLTDKDGKDTKLKKSYARSYTVKLSQGKAYRIDLSSKDFDTFLRLEDAKGKEVGFNDDIDLSAKNLDSRLIYVAPKTGDYKIIVTTFAPNTTGLFVLEMKYADEKEAAEARFMSRVERFAESTPAEQKKLVQEATKRFADKNGNLSLADARLAIQIAFASEDGDAKAARETYQSFIKIFAGAEEKRIAGVTKFFESNMKKLDLLGKEFPVSGKTVDGKDLDLKQFKGKVVLVDFWATWCGPCIAELPNMQAAYKKYHAKGFDIIGISLDRPGDDEKLANFIKNRNMAWPCINIEDSRPLATKYGVNAIPFPVLVGRDGRVVSYRARGPQLERLLERLMTEKK